MKKKIKYIGIVLVILFCCYNLFWYFGSYKPYNEFQKDFPEIEESGVNVRENDGKGTEDQCTYSEESI